MRTCKLAIGILSVILIAGCGGGGGGGSCNIDADCGENAFCNFTDGACGLGADGQCTDLPATCPADVAQVCTCEGISFDNACAAEQAGLSVAAPGECV